MAWFERDQVRLLREARLLKRHHPQARLVIQDGELVAYKKVQGVYGEYLIKVVYPHDFPGAPPAAFVVRPRLGHTPHQYQGGRLCLHSPEEVGPQTSGKVICDWAVRWIAAYERWKQTGHWPGASA
ncbi:MAG: hypothetical protein FJ291_10220 [Planctomycetes bacterium]|nr:hypothetical protein [Planctomycetota bacterium]